MPIELGIWKLGSSLKKVTFSTIESEKKLEDTLSQDISIISSDLMLIGRQITTAHGKYIDLLAMDAEGDVSIIELKKNKTPREAVAQLLDYASWVKSLTYEDISDIYSEKNTKALEEGFADAFGGSPPDEINKELKLILVAAELDSESERIINYLSDNYNVPINAVFFRYFEEDGNEYLTRNWLIDPQETESNVSRSTTKKGRESWNGQDYYVAFGDDNNRNWNDAIRYGFISAGGGRWYTRTLETLVPGNRVFACIPGTGYVGVGIVVESAKPVNEFTVEYNDRTVPILHADINAEYHKDKSHDPENAEYFVRVDWVKTVPVNKAYWEKGMYANQNTVTKLRNKFTLERLIQHFGLEE